MEYLDHVRRSDVSRKASLDSMGNGYKKPTRKRFAVSLQTAAIKKLGDPLSGGLGHGLSASNRTLGTGRVGEGCYPGGLPTSYQVL